MSRFQIAIALYVVLAVIAKATLTAVVDVNGRAVPIVWVVWALLAMFALRTWLHHQRARLAASSESDTQS